MNLPKLPTLIVGLLAGVVLVAFTFDMMTFVLTGETYPNSVAPRVALFAILGALWTTIVSVVIHVMKVNKI